MKGNHWNCGRGEQYSKRSFYFISQTLSSSPGVDVEEVNELDEVQHDQLVPSIPEDFLPKAWKRFSLDHDYLLELSLYEAESTCH